MTESRSTDSPTYVHGYLNVSEQLLERLRRDEDAFARAEHDPDYVFPEDWADAKAGGAVA